MALREYREGSVLRAFVLLIGILIGMTRSAAASEPDTSLAYRLAGHDPLSLAAQVGLKMFFDKSLSGSGKLACSSCHDPDHAYAPANGLDVQMGGKGLSQFGTRAVPSLRYKQVVPPYADLLDNPDGISPPGPGGGYTQDGRAPTLAEQAKIPLLAANEMANKDGAGVVARIRASSYGELFKQAFGEDVFANSKTAFEKAAEALQAFQMEDYSFHPFSSKYDLYAGNKIGGTLTAAEKRGAAVFTDPQKGNCAACHYSGAGLAGSVAIFTDYSYEAIGVPRNRSIPLNRNPNYFDLGICSRPDHPLPANEKYCGMFKTPTLRNVATRKVFYHNGQIKSLKEAIRFYNTRDTNPEFWYPTVNGVVQELDDLPPKYRGNLDRQAPLNGRERGSKPPMTEQEMDDLEVFLNTLTDDYHASPVLSAEALNPAVEEYLQEKGHLCLGKFSWPIAVSDHDRQIGAKDAVQMPVLEKHGLVLPSAGKASITQYDLSEAGRKYYLLKKTVTLGSGDEPTMHRGDLCGATLRLERLVHWEPPEIINGRPQTTVKFTYRIAEPADWILEADINKVFPMVHRILIGAGSLELEQAFAWSGSHWVAVVPGSPQPARSMAWARRPRPRL
jgi:cytochrome c peroxidase